MRSGICSETTNFNPRSREGSDSAIRETCGSYNISIHAPAKGATLSTADVAYFAPISIHAPAKGATMGKLKNQSRKLISIHAPAKGATVLSSLFFNIKRFQSTLPRRERPFILPIPPIHQTISIHAPAKGATAKAVADIDNSKISIHAPAKGATFLRRYRNRTQAFQSTLPRRERQIGGKNFDMSKNFNPRSREGSDKHGRSVNPN